MASTAVSRVDVPHVPWWTVLLEGIAAIILGILFLVEPGATTLVLVQIAGWYWLIMGVFSIINIFVDQRRWGWKLLVGILGILAGLAVILNPMLSAIIVPAAIVTYLAVWVVFIGVFRLIQAFSGAGLGTGILGVLNILLGAVMLALPLMSAVTFLYLFAIMAIVFGVGAVFAAFRHRGSEQETFVRRGPFTMPVTGEGPRDVDEGPRDKGESSPPQ